jgi:hypothetical protein
MIGSFLHQPPPFKGRLLTTEDRRTRRRTEITTDTSYCRKIPTPEYRTKPLALASGHGRCGWVGHVHTQKCRGPGAKGFAFVCFLPSGMHSTQKVPDAPARNQMPGQFPNRLEIAHKNVSGWLYKKSVTSHPYYAKT